MNGIAVWSQKWKKTNFQIKGKNGWSHEYWQELEKEKFRLQIYVIHILAYREDSEAKSRFSNIANQLTRDEMKPAEIEKEKVKMNIPERNRPKNELKYPQNCRIL